MRWLSKWNCFLADNHKEIQQKFRKAHNLPKLQIMQASAKEIYLALWTNWGMAGIYCIFHSTKTNKGLQRKWFQAFVEHRNKWLFPVWFPTPLDDRAALRPPKMAISKKLWKYPHSPCNFRCFFCSFVCFSAIFWHFRPLLAKGERSQPYKMGMSQLIHIPQPLPVLWGAVLPTGSTVLVFSKFQEAYGLDNSSVALNYTVLSSTQDSTPFLQNAGIVVPRCRVKCHRKLVSHFGDDVWVWRATY